MRIEKIFPALSINLTQIKIYNTLHPAAAAYTFFSRAKSLQGKPYFHHKTIDIKSKRIEIIQNMFSDHSGIILEINNRKIFRKCSSIWKLDNTLLKFHGQRNLKDNLKILGTE